MKQHKCSKCTVILNKDNWAPSQKRIFNYKCRECAKKERKLKRISLKLEIIAAYGGKCICCKCKTIEFLTIDHIDGGGAKHRKQVDSNVFYQWLKKNSYPKDNYQILCFNCNYAKHICGICPHQQNNGL